MELIVALTVGLIIGVVIGVVIVRLVSQSKFSEERCRLENSIHILEHDLEQQKIAREESESALRSEFAERSKFTEESSKKQLAMLEQARADADMRHKDEIAKLEARHKADLEAVDRLQQERMEAMRNSFRTMSADLLKQQSETFGKSNTEQINSLLTPLRAQLNDYRQSLEKTKDDYNKLNGSISEQCRRMIDETTKIGKEADRLTNALTHDSKVQGDWGETILEGLLANSGLLRNIHYTLQDVLRDPDGSIAHSEDEKTMRTDAIVHFPDGKDLVIDSKVSLTSYMCYCNAKSSDEQASALRAHCDSVKKHIDELAAKRYDSHPQNGRAMIDFTVMFVPVENALYTALSARPDLRDYADKHGVCLVTPMNLIAMLRIAGSLWTRADQEKNHFNIIKNAEQLLKRIGAFCSAIENIRQGLDNACSSYNTAAAILGMQKGKQSIVTSARNLYNLGVKLAPGDFKKLPKDFFTPQEESPLPGLLPEQISDESGVAIAEPVESPEPEKALVSEDIIDI